MRIISFTMDLFLQTWKSSQQRIAEGAEGCKGRKKKANAGYVIGVRGFVSVLLKGPPLFIMYGRGNVLG